MRHVFAVVLGVVASCQTASCLAVLVSFKASDGQYASPDANGSVDVWTNTPSGNSGSAGSFQDFTPSNGDNSNNGSAGAGPSPWTLYSNSGATSRSDAVIASLAGRNLGFAGDYISLDFDNGTFQSASGREVGVSLFDSSNAHQLTFRLQAGDATYEVVDDGGVHNTGIPSTDNGFKLTLTLADSSSGYTLDVFNTQSPGPINTTISSRLLEQTHRRLPR